METHAPAQMHQRSSNDTGPTQPPTHVDITFVLVRAHGLAPMQQRSNNEPGPNQHSKHVNITFGISESMIQHRCSNDPTTIQDGCSNSQLLILHWLKLKHTIHHRCNSVPTTIHDRTAPQTMPILHLFAWKHDPPQMQQRSINDPGPNQHTKTVNNLTALMEPCTDATTIQQRSKAEAATHKC